jgi:hypothetical protein
MWYWDWFCPSFSVFSRQYHPAVALHSLMSHGGMSNTALLTSFTEMVHLAEGLRLYALLILKAENSHIYLADTQTTTLSKMD